MPTPMQTEVEVEKNEKGEVIKATLIKKRVPKKQPDLTPNQEEQ